MQNSYSVVEQTLQIAKMFAIVHMIILISMCLFCELIKERSKVIFLLLKYVRRQCFSHCTGLWLSSLGACEKGVYLIGKWQLLYRINNR